MSTEMNLRTLLTTPVFTCEYITQTGHLESFEWLTGFTYCKRILDLWKFLEEHVQCKSQTWPKYIWDLFWNDNLSKRQCGQLAGFIFVNSITNSFVVQWFGLIGLKKQKRSVVYHMVNQLISEHKKYSHVTGYCCRREQHVYLDGTPTRHSRNGNGGNK